MLRVTECESNLGSTELILKVCLKQDRTMIVVSLFKLEGLWFLPLQEESQKPHG
jgi:hypothetical protein